MIRTQVQIDEGDYQNLKALAAERSTSVSQLVREGVGQVLEEAERDQRWKQLREVVGAFKDLEQAHDVAARHDAYLVEAYSDG